MKIVINHLTRMKPGFICVAGIDLVSGSHIRPVLEYKQISVDYANSFDGLFNIGNIVEFNQFKPIPKIPHSEDIIFYENSINKIGSLSPAEFWNKINQASFTNLENVFNDKLVVRKGKENNLILPLGSGKKSLGCLSNPKIVDLQVNSFGKLRILIDISEMNYGFPLINLSLTDLRFYAGINYNPNQMVIDKIKKHINNPINVIISIGLSRAFAPNNTIEQPVHWLQINNIHIKNNPKWTPDTI